MMPMRPATSRSAPLLKKSKRRPCAVEPCSAVSQWRGVCGTHRKLHESGIAVAMRPATNRSVDNLTCVAPSCGQPASSRSFCKSHYDAVVVRGAPLDGPIRQLMKRVPGDVRVERSGYVMVFTPDHPRVFTNGYVPQHCLVMEQVLGRYLLPGENVHHRNGVRGDNRPENLELWVTYQPAGQRPDDLVEWAQEILRRYGPQE